MRFRTRAFLLCFVPFALLLAVSCFVIQRLARSTVRESVRASLRANHLAVARARSRNSLRNSRFLRIAGENAGLKAGLQLLLFEPENPAARRTVEDQLRELCERMGFDFLMVTSPEATPLAGVARTGDGSGASQLEPVNLTGTVFAAQGLMRLDGHTVQLASVPIDLAEENLGFLTVGEFFGFGDLTTPAVLLQGGKVIQSGVPGATVAELNSALRTCGKAAECETVLHGVHYMSLPMEISAGGDYLLRSLQDMDSATGPVDSVLKHVFLTAGLLALLIAFLCSVATARSIGEPLAAVTGRLREAETTGLLPDFHEAGSRIHEIRDLSRSFNRAAASIREARGSLENAYLQFVGTLASALDARDPYTAGHSRRVSELACAIARASGFSPADTQRLRIGALLHDIGKIGVSDLVLQKPGRLTEEEFAQVRQHPVIGRRILETVHGFVDFLPAVELHHENWDGSGYPHGQRGEETPLDARIIHVADAYDAMTTNRPYRSGMSHEQALRILLDNAGTQFDGDVVRIFTALTLLGVGTPTFKLAEATAEVTG